VAGNRIPNARSSSKEGRTGARNSSFGETSWAMAVRVPFGSLNLAAPETVKTTANTTRASSDAMSVAVAPSTVKAYAAFTAPVKVPLASPAMSASAVPSQNAPTERPQGNRWLIGARPRTLPAAVVPVAVGTACGFVEGPVIWWRAALALVVALALQVGVNYANDYSDGVKGTDDKRVGPMRLVGSGLATASAVKKAAFISFGIAAIAGLLLAIATSWWLIAVGVTAIVAAWTYTGGPRPYGYAGFGELFVFVYFGVVATVGSAFVQHEHLSRLAWLTSMSVGLLAMALIVTNNLRDIPGDTLVGKNTLAVRLGDARTRILYLACVVGAGTWVVPTAILEQRWTMLISVAAMFVAIPAVRAVRSGAAGHDLIAVLGATGKVQLAFGALLTLGIALSR
jgi:1,4-dihydroxy-2-naphthoate polyprenyltransferase